MSPNHYVGLTIHNKNSNNLIHINSINKFVNINDLQEYNRNDIKGLVYVKGKFLKVNNEDFSYILKLLKESLIKKLSDEINYNDIEKIKYLKWCYDKLLLNNNDIKISNLNSNSICFSMRNANGNLSGNPFIFPVFFAFLNVFPFYCTYVLAFPC